MRGFARLLMFLTSVIAARAGAQQQYVLSAAPIVTISGETDATAQFSALLGVSRFTSGEIVLGSFDPVRLNVYSPHGVFVRTIARLGSGPGEMRMPMFFGRRGDSVVTFDLDLRRVTYYANAGAKRQARVRLPRAPGRVSTVAGVFPNGALLIVQVSYLRQPAPDGPARDRHLLIIQPADTAAPTVPIGEFAGYGLIFFTPPGEHEPHFLMDRLTSGTTWLMDGNLAAIADPDRPEVLMFNSNGKLARRVVLPVRPRPFDPKAVREARDRAAPVALGTKKSASPLKAAQDTAHFELMYDLSKRPKAAPYLRRLVRGTDGSVWVEMYREHDGRPSEYLRIDPSGRVNGRMSGPANVQFHEFGADYALGVEVDPVTDVQSVVLYSLSRR